MARFDALDLGFAPWARRRCFTSGEAKVSVDLTGLDGNRERERLSGTGHVSEVIRNMFNPVYWHVRAAYVNLCELCNSLDDALSDVELKGLAPTCCRNWITLPSRLF